MRLRLIIFSICLHLILCIPAFAQTNSSVSLESQIYYILEQAQLKGLCAPLSGARPYTRSVVISAINEILDSESEKLKSAEREILQQHLEKLTAQKKGMDWQRGVFHAGTTLGKSEIPLTLNVGGNLQIEGSSGYHSSLDDFYFGTETWLRFYLNGDISKYVSWEFSGEGGLTLAPRHKLGTYNTYYEGFTDSDDGEFVNRVIDIYSEPLTHFPYTYKKRWDGSIYFLNDVDSFSSWPSSAAGAYNLLSELSASFFENKLLFRLGRLSREWGSAPFGSSLSLNQMARPFLGIEYEFRPFSWFGISSLTGILEYYNTIGIKNSAKTFQNAFSISMLQFNYKNYFFLDLGEAVIWPKRFELGYPSIITNSIFYQNNIGDFDNMQMFFNLKAQYPNLGSLWFSLFWDEVWWRSDFYELDRTMWALQAGLTFPVPILSFTSVKLSYTKVNPYTYTHNRNINPWYGSTTMETSYTNNGVSLGYYLPPNSDELLFRFQTMPAKNVTAHLQYQMIRHGADYGSSAVDGSNLLSELDPGDRNNNPILKRFFLQDGAYQWQHIIKLGAEWKLEKAPVSLFGEVGTMISYFTNIASRANNAAAWEEWKNEQPAEVKANQYSVIDTPEYPKSTGFVLKLGVRIFPK